MRKAKGNQRLVGRDATSQLYRGVVRYIESNGGGVIVIGGVRIIEWPDERPNCFGLEIKIMGRKPRKESP